MRKIVLTGLLLVMASCFLLASCSGGEKTPGNETESAETPLQLNLLTGGKTEFVLIRAAGKNAALASSDSRRLLNALNEMLEQDMVSASDSSLAASDERYEILLGNTNRQESRDAFRTLKSGDYSICIRGRKLLILGGSEDATAQAVDWFIENFLKGKGDSVMFRDTDAYRYEKPYKIKRIAIGDTELSEYRIVIPEQYTITEYRTAYALQTHLLRNAGYSCGIVTDDGEPDAHEILIGNTARAALTVPANGYRIEQIGTRLCVAADHVYAYDLALEQLTGTVFPRTKPDITVEGLSLSGTDPTDRAERAGSYRILINNIYGGHQPQHPFAQRGEMLAELYRVYDPDIIGLQEFTDRADSIAGRMSGYTMVEVNSGGVRNCVPLFYKTGKFEVLASGYHRYTDGQNDNSKAVTWAVFRSVANGDVFAVASTHFSWKAEAGEARLTDAEQLTKLVADIRETYSCPVFFGGDFNCSTTSAPYLRVAGSGAVDVQKLAAVSSDSRTNHSYASYNSETRQYENPVKPSGTYADAIDHIFLSGGEGVSLNRFLINTDLYALLSTDHTPLILDFSMEAS